MLLTSRELEEYEDEIEKVMKRYVKRLQWLMSGKERNLGYRLKRMDVIAIVKGLKRNNSRD